MTPDDVQALTDQLKRLPTANIGDAMERFGTAAAIRPVWDGARVAGRAFTVWTRSGDNLYIHKAMEQITPGEVMVVNGSGDDSRALIGDLIGARAHALGVAGFVIDGAVRDANGLAEVGIPVFARGVTPAGPYKNGPGRLQIPVALGTVVVEPGDFIVGDEDGVVCIPFSEAPLIARRAEEIYQNEIAKRAAISESTMDSLRR